MMGYTLFVKDDLLGCLPLSLAPNLGAFPLKLGSVSSDWDVNGNGEWYPLVTLW